MEKNYGKLVYFFFVNENEPKALCLNEIFPKKNLSVDFGRRDNLENLLRGPLIENSNPIKSNGMYFLLAPYQVLLQ